ICCRQQRRASAGSAWWPRGGRGTARRSTKTKRSPAWPGPRPAAGATTPRWAEAVARIGRHDGPLEITPTVREFLDGLSEATGVAFDPDNPEELIGRLGTMARFVGATLRDTANPTIPKAGYKHNVIPQAAEAYVDGRFLPGHEELVLSTIRELAGRQVDVETYHRD